MTVNVPFVNITKGDGSLGLPEQEDPTGILALIAPRITGPSVVTPCANPETSGDNWGEGKITEVIAYTVPQTKKQVLVVPTEYSEDPEYGTITYVGTGTLGGGGFIAGDPASTPVDDFFPVTIRFVAAGTTGTPGITYQTSIDARAYDDTSKVWSAEKALGSGLDIEIEDTGIKFNLTTSKTVVAGDYFVCYITGPELNDGDVQNGLDALSASGQPWEAVLVESIDASTTTLSNLDSALADLEERGKFKMFICGARLRALDGSETEAQYLSSLTSTWTAAGSIRGSVTADGAIVTSPRRGIDMIRKTTFPYAARLMSLIPGRDAAETAPGNLAGTRITDPNGNLLFHDEDNDPGLNDQRFTTLRRWANRAGVYITNPLILSTPGSDYVLAQQVRLMNRACELAHSGMVSEMSKGVFQDAKTGKIREDSAQAIEDPINANMREAIGSQCQGVALGINRDDVLSPPIATLKGKVQLKTLIYIKGFEIVSSLVREITVNV